MVTCPSSLGRIYKPEGPINNSIYYITGLESSVKLWRTGMGSIVRLSMIYHRMMPMERLLSPLRRRWPLR